MKKKKQFSSNNFVDVRFESKTCKVEKADIASGVYVDTVSGVVENKF